MVLHPLSNKKIRDTIRPELANFVLSFDDECGDLNFSSNRKKKAKCKFKFIILLKTL